MTKLFGDSIKKVLDDLKDIVMHEWDGVIITVGSEGDGKTTLNKLMAYYIDNNITIKDVAFNSSQFEEAVEQADEYSSILWDESDDLSGHWASSIIQTLKRKFKRIRKKHLFIWLVTPTFFDMNKYWAIHRARCLFHVYAEPQRDNEGKFHSNRGRVRFFNMEKKRELYFAGVKTWNMYAIKPNFIEYFNKTPADYPITDEDYEAKKDQANQEVTIDTDTRLSGSSMRRTGIKNFPIWFENNRNKTKLAVKDFAWIFQVSEKTIDGDLAFLRKNNNKNNIIDTDEGGVPINWEGKGAINSSYLKEEKNINPSSPETEKNPIYNCGGAV